MKTRIEYLTSEAHRLGVYPLAKCILENPKFLVWSGSGKKGQHHYGEGGLLEHTAEVVGFCWFMNLAASKDFAGEIPHIEVFLAALYHDIGKLWDYEPVSPISWADWQGTKHKRQIHHISRSAIEWNLAAAANPILPRESVDNITHAILAHHGCREWGSPVAPKTKLAHLLHHCDAISARMNDAETFDCIK